MPSARQCQLTYAVAIVALPLVGFIVAGQFLAGGDPSLSSLATARHVEIWEGLPHPNMEMDTFAQEIKLQSMRNLQGHQFYDIAQQLAAADQHRLLKLLSEIDVAEHYVNTKSCEFHPDYALCWSDGSRQYAILFCLGCGEIRTVNQGRERAFEMQSREQYEALFKPYQRHRPSTEYFPNR